VGQATALALGEGCSMTSSEPQTSSAESCPPSWLRRGRGRPNWISDLDFLPPVTASERQGPLRVAWLAFDRHRRIASSAKWRYLSSQIVAILAGAVTPVLVVLDQGPRWSQALPGAVAVVATAIESLVGNRLRWLSHRRLAEQLDREITQFRIELDVQGGGPDEERARAFLGKVLAVPRYPDTGPISPLEAYRSDGVPRAGHEE
jgi:hypothetical protein